MTAAVTPLEALRRLYEVARKVDASESGEFDNALQGELAVAESVLRDAPPANLSFDLMAYQGGKHAEKVMQELGIEYIAATPQSAMDSWWFWGCKNVPESLPDFLSPLKADPRKWLSPTEFCALVAPVVPVAAQPVVQQGWKLVPVEPTIAMIAALGWSGDETLAMGHAMISSSIADEYAAMLAAAPSLEAQPAGEVVIMPQRLTPGMKSVLKEVAPKWNAESIYANLYDAAAMAQGDKHEPT